MRRARTNAVGRAGEPGPGPPAADRRDRLGDGELVLTLFVAASALLLARLQPLWGSRLVIVCPFLEITGLPCPTCGGTRALVALVGGHWKAAFAWNPGVAAAGVGAVLWLPIALCLLLLPVPRPALPRRLPGPLRWGVPLLIAANWGYLLLWLHP